MTTATLERNWTEIGKPYTDDRDRRQEVECVFAGLTWQTIPEGGSLSVGFIPGESIKTLIRELRLPKVSAIATDGCWSRLDPDEDGWAHYGVYGIEANYKNGRVRLYVLDSGTELVPLMSELYAEPKPEHWTSSLSRDQLLEMADELRRRNAA